MKSFILIAAFVIASLLNIEAVPGSYVQVSEYTDSACTNLFGSIYAPSGTCLGPLPQSLGSAKVFCSSTGAAVTYYNDTACTTASTVRPSITYSSKCSSVNNSLAPWGIATCVQYDPKSDHNMVTIQYTQPGCNDANIYLVTSLRPSDCVPDGADSVMYTCPGYSSSGLSQQYVKIVQYTDSTCTSVRQTILTPPGCIGSNSSGHSTAYECSSDNSQLTMLTYTNAVCAGSSSSTVPLTQNSCIIENSTSVQLSCVTENPQNDRNVIVTSFYPSPTCNNAPKDIVELPNAQCNSLGPSGSQMLFCSTPSGAPALLSGFLSIIVFVMLVFFF